MLKFSNKLKWVCESHLILLELMLRNLDIILRMTLISTNKDDTLLFEHFLDTRTFISLSLRHNSYCFNSRLFKDWMSFRSETTTSIP